MANRDKILLDAGLDLPKDWFYERHEIPIPQKGDEVVSSRPANPILPGFPPVQGRAIHAKDAQGKLADNVLENLTGVQARWLAGVRPQFVELVKKAQDSQLSDEALIHALEQAANEFPELFANLDTSALEHAMKRAMGAAVVNGAVSGAMKRGVAP